MKKVQLRKERMSEGQKGERKGRRDPRKRRQGGEEGRKANSEKR